MSISNALQTGVSGLAANSERVGGISANIANANTVGYRRSFSSFVTDNAAGRQSGVSAVMRADILRSGSMMSTGRLNDFAVSGEGFFVVSRGPNDPAASNYFLTRAGSFQPDADGNLRNAAGYYLGGFPVDASGAVGPVDRTSFSDLSTVNISQFQIAGTPSTRVAISGNLPAQSTGLATPGDAFISTTRYVDQLGGSAEMRISWQPTATANEWVLNVTGADGTDYGDATVTFADSGSDAGTPLTYTSTGLPIDPATGTVTLSIANGATPQTLALEFGAPGTVTGMTQFSGDFTAPTFDDDGAQTGSLVRAEMSQNGTLYGLFDNGQRRALFEVPLATVPAADLMQSVDGNVYATTVDSGSMSLLQAGSSDAGTIESGVLEASNVDIAQELTDLIQTQRAYSSNAKIVTTADEMLDETLRIKR